MEKTPALELKSICKSFGSVSAVSGVSMELRHSEILALLGENGSGKTTLMNIIAGIYYPDSGSIAMDGSPVSISSPKDASRLKIGMIHQHFKLVELFSAAENIALGMSGRCDISKLCCEINDMCARYGFSLDPMKRIYDMSVSEKQTVEIIKALCHGAEILILDEPTAVLTPQETERLFGVLRNMRELGKSIIIITHKLNEVLEISDRVAVLRKGEYVGSVETSSASAASLTEMMMGRKVSLNIHREEPKDSKERLSVSGLSCYSREGVQLLGGVSFTANSGEILGIAGVAGSGQRELLEAIAGLQPIANGSIVYHDPKSGKDENLRNKNPLEIRRLGVRLSFVPEDRLGMGLVGSMGISDNMLLRSFRKGASPFLERGEPKKLARSIIDSLEVVTPGMNTPVRRLSGGNVQKVLVGREIASNPTVLMAAYPVRGLDVNTTYTIYELLNKQKENGAAVIFVGEDLDVLIELCDRILVMCGGRVSGIVDGRGATKEELGLLMTKMEREGA